MAETSSVRGSFVRNCIERVRKGERSRRDKEKRGAGESEFADARSPLFSFSPPLLLLLTDRNHSTAVRFISRV